MSETDYLSGKVVIVTGAAGGFGRLVSEKAAALGARLVCADVDSAGLDQTVATLVIAQRVEHQK